MQFYLVMCSRANKMDICDRQISNLRQQLFKYNTFIIPIIIQDKTYFN